MPLQTTGAEPKPLVLDVEPAGALCFERRLDELHQMLYRRGGIRPVNAAIEELSKLLLLKIQETRSPWWQVPDHGPLHQILNPTLIRAANDVQPAKAAFRALLRSEVFAARLPEGGSQPIWPLDEPLRIERADVLAEALEILPTSIDAESPSGLDPLGTAFDVFLRGRYDHAGGLGTYLTPHTVAVHLARLTLSDLDLLTPADAQGPRLGDPCCGTGRFLLAGLSELAANADREAPGSPAQQAFAAFRRNGIFGADQSPSSVAKARVNLLLAGVDHPNIFAVRDSVTDRHVDALRGSLRLILTNPPFGDAQYDSEEGIKRTRAVLPLRSHRKRIDPALAFFVRCLDLLGDGGRLGIVLPDGIVDGPALRSALLRGDGQVGTRLREVSVEANISLPTATFALAGTVARTSALVIRRARRSRSHVFLARADHVGYVRQAGVAAEDPKGDDLPSITRVGVAAWTSGPQEQEHGVRFLSERPLAVEVPFEGLQSLDPARADARAIGAQSSLRKAGACRLGELIEESKRRKPQKVNEESPFISVLHINELGAVSWHQAIGYRPSTPGKVAEAGEVIVSLLNPIKLRTTVIPDDFSGLLCSAEFGVFRAAGDPYEILVALHHPDVRAQLAPLGRGTSSSRRRIRERDVLDLLVPVMDPDQLRSSAAVLRAALEEMRGASLRAAGALGFQSSSSESEAPGSGVVGS